MIGARLIAWAVAAAALMAGSAALRSRLVSQGDAQGAARVQAAWDAQERDRGQATARDNILKARNAERTAHEDAQRAAARLARDAAAATAVRGLRAEIARQGSRPRPCPPGDAGLAACAREAAAARELLGDCSGAYQELAAAADGLRDQVTGLQGFARDVCGAATPEPLVD